MLRISSLRLTSFKGFSKFNMNLGQHAFIVGPNNAGKSTVIEALKASAYMLRYAKSRSPADVDMDGSKQVVGYRIGTDEFGLVTENIQHEFRNVESRVEVTFSNKAKLTALWPSDHSDVSHGGFFYLTLPDTRVCKRPAEAKKSFPTIGVVPLLGPVEDEENILSKEHVRRNLDGSLASRHFRNQLFVLPGRATTTFTWSSYLEMVEEWLPEIQLGDLQLGLGGRLDLYYTEGYRTVEKELSWAGDGVQVWLQVLMHLVRVQDSDVVLLDEPDVFLHPDLQRRLVRLLEGQPSQTVMASHSAEVLSEASSGNIVWADRRRNKAVRSPDDSILQELEIGLGSSFSLRLARVLKTRAVLFVEGSDMRLLANLARVVGAEKLAKERDVTVIPIHGFDNWPNVDVFRWLSGELLGDVLHTFVILDSGYRSSKTIRKIEQDLREVGVEAHIWRKKELESYLLVPSLVSRLSGLPEEDVGEMLEAAAESLEIAVESRVRAARLTEATKDRAQWVTVEEASAQEFRQRWKASDRVGMCPAKQVLRFLNRELQQRGAPTLGARRLSSEIAIEECDEEIVSVLMRIEHAIV
jgi:energy-coupling factor transporter ATP-binding protein EcfA2